MRNYEYSGTLKNVTLPGVGAATMASRSADSSCDANLWLSHVLT